MQQVSHLESVAENRNQQLRTAIETKIREVDQMGTEIQQRDATWRQEVAFAQEIGRCEVSSEKELLEAFLEDRYAEWGAQGGAVLDEQRSALRLTAELAEAV